MRFHAKLIGVEGLDRPKSTFSATLAAVESWADEILRAHPGGSVEIWEEVPKLVRIKCGVGLVDKESRK